jgi:hypothetical protein
MESEFKGLTDFLVGIGIERIPHTTKSYLGHLIAVYRDLKVQGYTEDVCRAGMFHSIYGTEKFQGFILPLDRRDEVRTLIGARAEHLAYLNCAMDRPSFDKAVEKEGDSYAFSDRISADRVLLGQQDFDDLCAVHFYDWLEQVARSGEWDYRRSAYRRIADRLGPAAVANFERVYAQESTGA